MTFFSFCRLTVLVTMAMFATVLIDRASPLSSLISQAVAQDEKKEQRETRRTPALRNKVYERLAEAQVLAEEKNYAGAKEILDDMISEEGKRALNSYELAKPGAEAHQSPDHVAILPRLERHRTVNDMTR